MGCCAGSSGGQGGDLPQPGDEDGPDDVGAVRKNTKDSDAPTSQNSGSRLSRNQHSSMHRRLKKLQELDETTKIPFILVELRGISHKHGFVEICGKDEYGVYQALDTWLTSEWGCVKLDAGDLSEDTMVPFCDALYEWSGFKMVGAEGLNNMGLSTMRLVDKMTKDLSWTLAVVNGGNVGEKGEVREQQCIFKAPHPMNLVAPHIMIELRSAGYIEVCGDDAVTLDEIQAYFEENFKAKAITGHEEFCDRYYRTGPGVFKERGSQGENNLGLLTTQVCDAFVRIQGWSLVTCNGGNYGESGDHREQQLVFRWDNHPLRENSHFLVELRDAGFIEICGQDVDGIYARFGAWLKEQWGCTPKANDADYYGAKYAWPTKDYPDKMMASTAAIIGWFHSLGWQMQVCSQGTVKVRGCADSREQQIILRPGASAAGVKEPHLIVELYMGEGTEELYKDNNTTQVFGNQYIRMCPVGDCREATKQLGEFIGEYMGGSPDQVNKRYNCDVFLGRGQMDNNLGQWTMRFCDFMVDRLGWSFIVCNVCNMGDFGHFREQQLVFRFDGYRREVPKARNSISNVDSQIWDGLTIPDYWKIPEILNRESTQKAAPCDQDEIQSLQEMMDATFKRILTRDRVYEYQAGVDEEMPFHLEVIHAFRSENALLLKRFQQRTASYQAGEYDANVKSRADGRASFVNSRLGNGEAYLFHGTNPSSSMSILKTGFSLDAAGKSTGTMFGYGIYLAECSSKSDEYARDDGGNTFPGLMAMLVCRCLVGNPLVVQDAGDHIAQAREGGFDCVIGDREAKVNTYREFVFFDETQVVPEFTVIYRRNYDSTKAPRHLRRKTQGTTGRNWQVKLDKGWTNVQNEANRQLLAAMQQGISEVTVKITDFEYVFDLEKRTQVNVQTGTTRQLRPPMIK